MNGFLYNILEKEHEGEKFVWMYRKNLLAASWFKYLIKISSTLLLRDDGRIASEQTNTHAKDSVREDFDKWFYRDWQSNQLISEKLKKKKRTFCCVHYKQLIFTSFVSLVMALIKCFDICVKLYSCFLTI